MVRVSRESATAHRRHPCPVASPRGRTGTRVGLSSPGTARTPTIGLPRAPTTPSDQRSESPSIQPIPDAAKGLELVDGFAFHTGNFGGRILTGRTVGASGEAINRLDDKLPLDRRRVHPDVLPDVTIEILKAPAVHEAALVCFLVPLGACRECGLHDAIHLAT